MSVPIPNASARRSHRKRISALRLSSDTTSTLPEYLPAGWHPPKLLLREENDAEEDRPPDYPDSAEEADEDTDTDSNLVYVPQLPPASSSLPRTHAGSPRRSKRFFPTHKRRQSSQPFLAHQEQNDPYLDSLLERSVHALEMSNTLLQSSISTQTSLSTVLASDAPGDSSLEARAIGLSSRIRDTWDSREIWADDLEEITRSVEGLFGDDPNSKPRRPSARSKQNNISCSLPSTSSLSKPLSKRRNRRVPSLDLQQASEANPKLHYSRQSRANLISPPPRALTQFVASTQDAESILLPSTIGLRSPPSLHHSSDWRPLCDLASTSTTSLLSTPSFSSPKLTDKPLDPSTPAYNMLSSFVYRAPPSGSATPSTSFTSSFMTRRRDSGNASTSTEQSKGKGTARRGSSTSPASHRKTSDRIHRQDRCSGSGSESALAVASSSHPSQIPKHGVSPFAIRAMTPPAEESSSSSDGCLAKRTVQSLRKIMDDQPLPPATLGSMSRTKIVHGQHLRPPVFLPRTPAPTANAGTSTATASISRLFTKGTHSSSTHAPSPPRQSALKRSTPSTPLLSISRTPSDLGMPPTPTATTLSLPDLVSKVLGGGGSTSSSGHSTPNSKRISFAKLPESYASTRPPSQRFKDKQSRRRNRKTPDGEGDSQGLSGVDAKGKGRDDGIMGGWWTGWLTGGPEVSLGTSLARHEERIEDRMTRSWGGRMNSGLGGALDDWAV